MLLNYRNLTWDHDAKLFFGISSMFFYGCYRVQAEAGVCVPGCVRERGSGEARGSKFFRTLRVLLPLVLLPWVCVVLVLLERKVSVRERASVACASDTDQERK